MYGVVLLMAVTAGGESADLGRRGRDDGGCCGYSACYGGCYGGGYGCCGYATASYGCCGGYATASYGCCGGYATRGYGCCGYATRSYGCCGYATASYGCCGGYATASYGCCGGYATASYGYGCCGGTHHHMHIGHGCCGGTVHHAGHVTRVAAVSPNAATVVVTLPADAKLTIDGAATTSTSTVRTFETPELTAGKTYSYTLEATFQQGGKAVVVSKKVKIEAGKTSTVDLNQTPTGVARN